jgi:hypothetical protein
MSHQLAAKCYRCDCIPALGDAGPVCLVTFLLLKRSILSCDIWHPPLKKMVSLFSSVARFSAFAMRILISDAETYFSKPQSLSCIFHLRSLQRFVNISSLPHVADDSSPCFESIISLDLLHCACKSIVLIDIDFTDFCFEGPPILGAILCFAR